MVWRILLVAQGLAASLVLLTLAAAPTHVVAGDARIARVQATVNDHGVLTSFRLENAFDDNLRRRIDSGLPTTLVYELRLVRTRRSWLDKVIARSTLQVVAMYNAVTREYLINFKHDGNLVDSRIVRAADEVQRAMTTFDDLPTFHLRSPDPEARFRVRVRAELGTSTLLFFIPTTRTTGWGESASFRFPTGLAGGK